MKSQLRERSLFWPIVLIGAGVIWLLANFGVIRDANWSTLWRLWPLGLIAAGLDMLLGRGRPWAGALIGLLTVGAAVALLVAGPGLGLVPPTPEVVTETFSEPLDGAASADITLDLADYPTFVSALADGEALIQAELTHAGVVKFAATGAAARQVTLDYNTNLGFFMPDFSEQPEEWHIGLSPSVPLALRVDIATGAVDLDLTELELSELEIDGGTGALALTLPAAAEFYEVRLDAGAGAQTVRVPVGAAGLLEYEGGNGSLRLDVAGTAAVRIEVRDSGPGRVRVPSEWEEIEAGSDDEGVWQSATFDDAEDRQLLIIVSELGTGIIVVSEQ